MKWFQYTQNNSGGSFHVDDKVAQHVLIQAPTPSQADSIAEAIVGIYFNGVEDGRDCDCCGDRWSAAWSQGYSEPLVYGKPPANYGDECVRIYPFGSFNPVSIKDLENLPKPMVIEPS